MQVKLEPTSDDDYDLAYSSTGSAAATDDRKPGAGSADDDDDDDDDEFEEVGLDAGPTSAPLASRQADDEEHPALILRRQQEAEEAAAAAASATGGEGADAGAAAARPVFRDGKGGNRPPIEVQIAVPEELELKGKGKKKCVRAPLDAELHVVSDPAPPSEFGAGLRDSACARTPRPRSDSSPSRILAEPGPIRQRSDWHA